MKRRLLALLLAVLTLTMLTAAAFAADSTAKGVYNVRSLRTGYTLTVEGDSDGGFYANASQFTLACKDLTGNYSLALLLQQDANEYPTEANLYYIDQVDIKKGEATFSIIPKAMTDGKTYNVYVSTNGENGELTKVASFQYGEKPPYTLGDVDNNGSINSLDALLVLKHVAGIENSILTGTYLAAADVNKDSAVNSLDALLILKRVAGIEPNF